MKWSDGKRIITKLLPPESYNEIGAAMTIFTTVKRDLEQLGLFASNVDQTLLEKALRELDEAFNAFMNLIRGVAEEVETYVEYVDPRGFWERLFMPFDPNPPK